MTNDIETLKAEIQTRTEAIAEEIVALRRYFHQYPELSWKEQRTAKKLMEILAGEGIDAQRVCETGVVAEIDGGEPGATIAFRADMDALPLNDEKEVPYASRVPGVMHACGHDCHMAIAIGIAKVLKSAVHNFPGKVRLIFQPCEETIPSGAKELVKANAVEEVAAIFAYHVDPELPAGKVGLRAGVLTANCNEFKLTISGKSGHAARPHQAVDTIYLSNRILSALYDIVDNRSTPFVPAVMTIGKIDGGTKANVIPDVVNIAGTIRTIDQQSLSEILAAIEERVVALTRAAGGGYQLEFLEPVPAVTNDPALVNLVRDVAGVTLGDTGVIEVESVSMGGEDFSWFLTKAPGALIRLGAKNPGSEVTFLHSSRFDVDERALPLGVSLMTVVLLSYLVKNAQNTD